MSAAVDALPLTQVLNVSTRPRWSFIGPFFLLLVRRWLRSKLRPMSVQEIEAAVTSLPAQELHQFALWFEEYLATQWDGQISADIASGKLDALLNEADADYSTGTCKAF